MIVVSASCVAECPLLAYFSPLDDRDFLRKRDRFEIAGESGSFHLSHLDDAWGPLSPNSRPRSIIVLSLKTDTEGTV